jgi:hypothetical protein
VDWSTAVRVSERFKRTQQATQPSHLDGVAPVTAVNTVGSGAGFYSVGPGIPVHHVPTCTANQQVGGGWIAVGGVGNGVGDDERRQTALLGLTPAAPPPRSTVKPTAKRRDCVVAGIAVDAVGVVVAVAFVVSLLRDSAGREAREGWLVGCREHALKLMMKGLSR